MIMRLSVADATTGTCHDVEVEASPDSSVRSLLDTLPIVPDGRQCYVGTVPLDPEVTIADSPLLHGSMISVGAPGLDPRSLPGGAIGALRVVAGPDAGLVTWLTPGTHTVGRLRSASICLRDEDVSRRHAKFDVSSDGAATVTDCESSNGTFVDGERLSGSVAFAARTTLEVGRDRLEWVPRPTRGLRTARSSDGRLDFDRAFARSPTVKRAQVKLPAAPASSSRGIGTVLLSGALPLILGGVLAVALGPQMLLFALLGPVSALGSYWVDRRQGRSRQRAFEQEKRMTQSKIGDHTAAEERLRRQAAPDHVDLIVAATGAGPGVWPRDPEGAQALELRVGTTEESAAFDLSGDPWDGFDEPTVSGVPLTVNLRDTGVLGVVGQGPHHAALVRWLLVQLGTLRSPDDLRIVVITSGTGTDLSWTGWLPHVDSGHAGSSPCWIGNTEETRAIRIKELKQMIDVRLAARRAALDVVYGEEIVVVLHGALALRHLPGMREVLREGPSVGVFTICVDRDGMNECRGLCEIDHDTLLLTRTRNDEPLSARSEGLDRETSEHLARALAPMRDRLTLSGAEAAVPYPVRFLDLVGVTVPTAEAVLDLWDRQRGPTTVIPLGADGAGPVTVDLATQGPHVMLAGTIGAGKSFLLQALVTSLLLTNRPDELNVVLVDFKGGSAFLPFQSCPHVVGLIRSTGETAADVFDEAATRRVLASVAAEVRRRESLLARYGGEIDEYWKARRHSSDLLALPRLVMVFDEFARVLEASPDFLKELVKVAAKGRSLGIHLVLATQSLQGKLSPELKNNIDLRITLRQNEPADSVEVLGVPDAVTIPGQLRGRGMIVCTKDESRTPRIFQSGYLGNPPPTTGPPPARVRIAEWPVLGSPRPEARINNDGSPTDQQLTVEAVIVAAGKSTAPFRPLLPPLPAKIQLADLEELATVPPPDTAVAFGLADDPVAQAQPAARLDLAGTDRLLVAGGPQSGRTTFVRTLAASLVTRFDPGRVHVYLLEREPGSLSEIAALPHCGAVLSPGEPDRIRRFVTWLDAEVQRRRLARSGSGGNSEPWIVVVLNGWEHFENRSDPNFVETSLLTTLLGIITAGPTVGIHVVAVGGQDMMVGKLSALYSHRLLLPFPKEDTRRSHLPSGVVSAPVLRGRAVDAATGTHVQVCIATKPTKPTSVVDPSRLPRRFPALPTRISLDDLQLPDPPPSPTWIPLGLGGDSMEPIGLDLFETNHLLLVSGPGGSGRTSAAASLAHALRRVGIGVLAIAPPRSPLRTLLPDDAGVRIVTGTNIKDADLRDAAESFGDGRYTVVLDDCEQLELTPSTDGYTPSPTLLDEISNAGSRGRQALIICGNAAPILNGQRRSLVRVVNEVMTDGARLVLTPTNRISAHEHGLALEPDQFFSEPPGRGYLSASPSTILLQVAREW